jgi:hypothetical protein
MSIDPDRLADLRSRKLAALVRVRWGEIAGAPSARSFPDGAALVDEAGGRVWVLAEGDAAATRLGGALAVALRADVHDVHVIVDDREAGSVLARRASQFATPPSVWFARGADLEEVAAAPPAVDPPVAPEAELYRPVLAAAGLEPVAEGGSLLAELRGLEVARVVVDERGARVETGVGRFDREAGALMFADQAESDALARVVALVASHRHDEAKRHPGNQLVLERWLRRVVIANPELVGARSLEAVPSAVPRRNLLEPNVASALGEDLDGRPLIVTCSTTVNLDLVPCAADDRLALAPGARLVLAVPTRDAVPITVDLAASLAEPAEVVGVPDDWRSLGTEVGV